jgi:hypothetical protein
LFIPFFFPDISAEAELLGVADPSAGRLKKRAPQPLN